VTEAEKESRMYSMLPFFCRVFSQCPASEMLDKFPEVGSFCQQVSESTAVWPCRKSDGGRPTSRLWPPARRSAYLHEDAGRWRLQCPAGPGGHGDGRGEPLRVGQGPGLRGQVQRTSPARDGAHPRTRRWPTSSSATRSGSTTILQLILVQVGFEQHNNNAGNEPNNSLAFRDLLADLDVRF